MTKFPSEPMDAGSIDAALSTSHPNKPKAPSLAEVMADIGKDELNRLLAMAGRGEVKYDRSTGDFVADDIEGVKRIAHTFLTAGCFGHLLNGCNTPEAQINRLVVVITNGRSLGLTPTAACTDTYIMNGKLCMFGDAMLAAVMRSDKCLGVPCTYDPKMQTATATARRKNSDGSVTEYVQTFSMEQAKAAGYTGKSGPWKNTPERMLQWRARTWAIRDAFPDLLKGMADADEQRDIEESAKAERTGATAQALGGLETA